MKIYPSCVVCNAVAWKAHGGSFGGIPSIAYLRCSNCDASLADIWGGHLSVVIATTGEEPPNDWVQKAVRPVMRRRDREAEAWRDKIYETLYETAFGFRRLPVDWQWTDAKRALLDEVKQTHYAATGENVMTYEGLTLPDPVIAQVPPRDVAWVWVRPSGAEVYTLLDPEATKGLPFPLDPIREDEDRFWTGLDAWIESKGWPRPEREERRNEYSPRSSALQPWYRWKYRHVSIVLGPRKRVYELNVSGLHRAQVESFRVLAARENVTFNAMDLVFEIHAWGAEKVREYLARVYEAAEGPPGT